MGVTRRHSIWTLCSKSFEMAPRGRPFIDFTSTYSADFSSGGRGRSGRPSRSLSAAPTYRPSAGSIPTSGRPSTRSGSYRGVTIDGREVGGKSSSSYELSSFAKHGAADPQIHTRGGYSSNKSNMAMSRPMGGYAGGGYGAPSAMATTSN